jgi:hypothetical protein
MGPAACGCAPRVSRAKTVNPRTISAATVLSAAQPANFRELEEAEEILP